MAIGARLTGRQSRTFVMLGDGECQEGEVWEAAFVAARYRLDRLIAVVDHNGLQQFGWLAEAGPERIPLPPEAPGELVAKWSAFGWRVLEMDGHDMADIVRTLDVALQGDGRPVAVIAHTVKGHGVSFMEDKFYWHTRILSPEEYAAAMAELGEPVTPAEGGAR